MLTRISKLMLVAASVLLTLEHAAAQSSESEAPSAYGNASRWSDNSPAATPTPTMIENPLVRQRESQPQPQYPATEYPNSNYSPPNAGSAYGNSSERTAEASTNVAIPRPSPNALRLPIHDASPIQPPVAPAASADPVAPATLQAESPGVEARNETPISPSRFEVQPAAAESPVAESPLPLAPRTKSSRPDEDKSEPPSTAGALGGVAGSLAIVLGLFFAIVWFSKRYMPQASSALPKEAVEMLGWAPLGGRTQMQLVRIGNKLVLISVSNGVAEPLTEVTDLLEVERLTAICRRTKPGSSSESFRQVMAEFERQPATGGFVGTTPPDAAATPARTGRTLGRLGAAVLLAASLAIGADAQAQQNATSSSAAVSPLNSLNAQTTFATPAVPATPELPSTSDALNEVLSGGPEAWVSPQRLSSSLQIMLLLTVLSLAPAVLLMTTSFVRIIVVLGLLKQALGTQQLPPSQVMTALALFMTLLVMTPTWREVYNEGIQPYSEGKLTNPEEAWARCAGPIKRFLSRQIEVAGNSDDVWLFYDYLPEAQERSEAPTTYEEIPLQALLPAFMLSELKTAFLIGFQIYLPFLILDIVVSSVTISMGMMMLPPVMISLPLKLLLFVLVDGWNLVVGMLLDSFGPAM